MEFAAGDISCLHSIENICRGGFYAIRPNPKGSQHILTDVAFSSPIEKARRDETLASPVDRQCIASSETEEFRQGPGICTFCEMRVLLYKFDLPSEEDCMLAERCYASQVRYRVKSMRCKAQYAETSYFSIVSNAFKLQWHVIPLDKEAMSSIRQHRRKDSLNMVQLAYLYTVLALTGRLAPSTDKAAFTLSLSWSNKRIKYIQLACDLLDHLDECRVARQSLPPGSNLLKAQCGLLIARYYLLQKGKDREAYERLQKCLQDADQMGYFDEPTETISLHEEYIRAELYIHDNWYMLIKGRPARSEPLSEYSTRWKTLFSDDIDSLCLKQKCEIFVLAAKIGRLLLSIDKNKDWLIKAEKTDLEIIDYISELESQTSARTLPCLSVDTPTELATFKQQYLCTSTILFFRSMRLHLLTAQTQAAKQNKSKFSMKRLQTANDVLRQMPKVKTLLCTTWNSLAQSYQPWLHVEAAMSTFANAIEQTGFRSLNDDNVSLQKQATTSLVLPPPPQLVTFVASFSHIYDLLNDLGYLGGSTIRCAQMIKVVPIICATSISPMETQIQCKNSVPADFDDKSISTGSITHYSTTKSILEAPVCDLCRERKVKCDRQKPVCTFCADRGVSCTTSHRPKKRGPISKIQRQLLANVGLHYDRKLRRWCTIEQEEAPISAI